MLLEISIRASQKLLQASQAGHPARHMLMYEIYWPMQQCSRW
jgi:hypothetical protein